MGSSENTRQDGPFPVLPGVSVVVPTYREAANLPELLARLDQLRREHGLDLDVFLMDDDSRDGTEEAVARAGLDWVRLTVRTRDRGLSAAVMDGFRLADKPVVLVMDAGIGPTVQDKHIAAKITAARKGCVLIINKWDLSQAKGLTQTQAGPALFKEMAFMAHCPLVFMSAKDGYNVRKSIDVIDAVAAQTRTQLPTGMLNRVLEEACERITMPSAGRKHLRVFYATQTGVAPIRLRLFVNDTKLVKKSFIDYLERKVRERFGLEGAPLVLAFVERPRPERAEGKPAPAPRGASQRYHAARKSRNRRGG